jgi:hypothetical protein
VRAETADTLGICPSQISHEFDHLVCNRNITASACNLSRKGKVTVDIGRRDSATKIHTLSRHTA